MFLWCTNLMGEGRSKEVGGDRKAKNKRCKVLGGETIKSWLPQLLIPPLLLPPLPAPAPNTHTPGAAHTHPSFAVWRSLAPGLPTAPSESNTVNFSSYSNTFEYCRVFPTLGRALPLGFGFRERVSVQIQESSHSVGGARWPRTRL